MILVDTSVWIEFLRATDSKADRALAAWIDREEELATAPVIVAELLSGVGDAHDREELLAHLLSFPAFEPGWPAGWARIAALRRQARRAGGGVPLIDCLIGATALEHGAVVAHRDADFERLAAVAGLRTLPLFG